MALKVYEYSNCGTCKKALKFLAKNGISFEAVPIVETPPTKGELKNMLIFLKAQGGGLKNLFNTSGVLYKEMKMTEKLPKMSEAQAIDLLAQYGKLVKRPFVLGKSFGMVGFKQEQWEQNLL
jgi:arsenate reductase